MKILKLIGLLILLTIVSCQKFEDDIPVDCNCGTIEYFIYSVDYIGIMIADNDSSFLILNGLGTQYSDYTGIGIKNKCSENMLQYYSSDTNVLNCTRCYDLVGTEYCSDFEW